MDLFDFVHLLRRYALLIAVVTVLGFLGAAVAAYTTASTYQSTAQLYASTPGAAASVGSEFSSGVLTGQRIRTYVQLVNSPAVTAAVAAGLGDPGLAGQIGREVTASNPPETLLIDLTVRDPSPLRAQRIAAGVSAALQGAIRRIETGSPLGRAPVTIAVVRPATYDPAPVAPDRRLDVALGLVLGLVAGLAAALLWNALDTSVRGAARLGAEFGAPVLAVVGAPRRAGRGSRKRPVQGSGFEPYLQLRTSLQFLEPAERPRSVVVTSPAGGEGKTRVVANLGRAFARAGAHVLLIDADLRSPSLARELGARPAGGLTDVLIAGDQVPPPVLPVERHLDLLPAGSQVANRSELLGSEAMARLVSEAVADYDFVFLDAPSVLPAADARALAAVSEGVIVVVQEGRTKHDQLATSVQLLDQVGARLTGFVLTGAERGWAGSASDEREWSGPAGAQRTAASAGLGRSLTAPAPPARPGGAAPGGGAADGSAPTRVLPRTRPPADQATRTRRVREAPRDPADPDPAG